MKKIIYLVLILVVLGGAGTWFYFAGQNAIQMEDCLAANPIFYVKFSDVGNNIEKFSQSNLWNKLAQINYDLIIEKMFINPSQKASAKLVKKQITDPNLWNVLNKFFGREFALAVYPTSVSLTSNDPRLVEELSSSFVLASRIEPNLQIAEFISRSFQDLGPDMTTEIIKYKAQTIHMVSLPNAGLKVGIVRLGNILVAGLGDKMVKASIDIYARQHPSLSQDQNFKKVRPQFIPSSAVVGYWNMESFFAGMKNQLVGMSKGSAANQQQMDSFLKAVGGFKFLSFSAMQSDFLVMNWKLFTSFQEMDTHVAKFYTSCAPKENKSLNIIPSNAIGYGWGTCVNLANYWEEFQTEVDKADNQTGKNNGRKNIAQFEQTTGLNIENDIIPAFGNEMGGYITDVELSDAPGSFPMPKILFFVEYGDKSKMDVLLGKLNGNPLFSLKQEDYKGSSIKYVSLPTQSQVEPGFCYLDKYLMMAFDKTLLEKSVDAFQDHNQSLANTSEFKKLGAEMQAPSTSIQFAKLDQFVQIIEKLIQWSDSWANQEKEKRQAFKLGTKRRLSDVAYQLESNREQIDKMKKDVELITAQIAQEQSTGLDVAPRQKELSDLQGQITATEKDVQAEEDQQKELEAMIAKYEKDEAADLEEKQFLLKKAVLPVLEAFKSVQLLGGFSTLDDQIFSTTIKLEVQ